MSQNIVEISVFKKDLPEIKNKNLKNRTSKFAQKNQNTWFGAADFWSIPLKNTGRGVPMILDAVPDFPSVDFPDFEESISIPETEDVSWEIQPRISDNHAHFYEKKRELLIQHNIEHYFIQMLNDMTLEVGSGHTV